VADAASVRLQFFSGKEWHRRKLRRPRLRDIGALIFGFRGVVSDPARAPTAGLLLMTAYRDCLFGDQIEIFSSGFVGSYVEVASTRPLANVGVEPYAVASRVYPWQAPSALVSHLIP
jgi:hypothetical protein